MQTLETTVSILQKLNSKLITVGEALRLRKHLRMQGRTKTGINTDEV